MTTPAGWYPDPDGSGGRRYFNGQSWTDQPAQPVPSSGPNMKIIAGVIAAVVALSSSA